MDIRKVKKLIELLEESNIGEIEIKEGEESVRISRYGNQPAAPVAYAAPAPAAPAPAAAAAEAAPEASAPAAAPVAGRAAARFCRSGIAREVEGQKRGVPPAPKALERGSISVVH